MEKKGTKTSRKAKCDGLVDYNSLPAYLKDNEFILNYYRAEWPVKKALLSIFCIHNETLNIWTHLIGFFIFVCLTIYTTAKAPYVIDFQLPDMFRSTTDLHQIQAQNCTPPLPNMTDFNNVKDELMTSLPSKYCLPKELSNITNQTENSALRNQKYTMTNIVTPPLTVQKPITRWPFYAFLGGAMFCLLASTTCHLLACHSEHLRYVLLRFDYAGITTLIATSFYPAVYYSFLCYPVFCQLYLGFITAFSISTILFSLLPAFQKPHLRFFRASLFFVMGISGVVPIIHKMVLYGNHKEAMETTLYEAIMGFFYGIGAFLYASRVPERWRPGKFDIVCSSHQLFHVLVVAGAYTHYNAGLVYLKWRDMEGC
ncbi:Heptahelical transmembrane protein [Actinidia chinensis var. chinensis]|uniref:Heptahelical transmembrane protein n=1 Tax=Actinidia chinensis var. chinensis TaxID=1590841 RepID=A0A2R6Q0H9_ACTCC|nr:Heptahelical transmembrane protein [Actinidia chinensis var. chinensis]